MFKKICLILISSAILVASPNTAVLKSSNIKKIIRKKDKIVVVIRENGKDKKIVLSAKELESLSKKEEKRKKVTEKYSQKGKSKSLVAKVYKIKRGDTLFSIARKFKVSLGDIKSLNKLGSSTLIRPGNTIKIPVEGYAQKAKEAVEKNNKTVYKVKKGDTLYSIARLYNMKPSTVRSMNNLKKNPKLKPGMELNVLGKPIQIEQRKQVKKYAVKRGDTLYSISKKFNITIAQLKLLNPKLRIRGLRRGSILRVSKIDAIKLAKRLRKRRSRLSGALARYQRSYSSGSGNRVVRYAKRWLGSRYVWGASRPGAFDCSGFTQFVMRHAKGRAIPRISRRQAYYGKYVSRRNLRAGDLIFFDTSHRRRGYVNHVGIYIGGSKFIHASSAKHRVVITSLNKPFYSSRFMWGRRIN